MEKEYYTPTIGDLYFGYQFEYLTISGEWVKHKFNGADMQLIQNCFTEGNNKDTVRTKYLCKQDIIDLGFIQDICFLYMYKIPNTDLYFQLDKQTKEVIISSYSEEDNTVFKGKCKSKNELKKLMKDYLNIPI